jgi:hypothetical protein
MTDTDKLDPTGSRMLFVTGVGYVNALSAKRLGLRGEEAYEIVDAAADQPPVTKSTPNPDNDNPVFGIAETSRELPNLEPATPEWSPPCSSTSRGQLCFRYGLDGPSIDWRLDAQAARLTSNRHRGQASNDNIDWPLQKLLKAEGNDHCLALAERYRDLWNAANMPCQLVGKDIADDLYVLGDRRLDASTGKFIDKGVKAVTGKRAQVDVAPKRAVAADPDKTKRRAKPVPRAWHGDWPLLHHIDASRELAAAQGALGMLRDGFEAAVCHGETLEAIGRDHGAGNKKGAAGGGRVLVFLGLQAVDEFWRKPARRAA